MLRIGASCRQTTIFSVFALGSGLKYQHMKVGMSFFTILRFGIWDCAKTRQVDSLQLLFKLEIESKNSSLRASACLIRKLRIKNAPEVY